MTVGIIDYGAGNLRSVVRACQAAGLKTRILAEPGEMVAVRALILPGVGHFGYGMERLAGGGWVEPLKELVAMGKPLLGICLGMQLLFEGSEESPEQPGLALLPGRVVRFRGDLKVPHMGWNQLEFTDNHWGQKLFQGLNTGAYCYFVHSYFVEAAERKQVAAWSEYGRPFAAAVAAPGLWGVQFHPEKSSRDGLRILKNFGELIYSADYSGH